METFSDPNHMPVFLDAVVANASREVLGLCGEDAACIFDFTQTGSEEIAMATMQTNANNTLDLEQIGKWIG